MIETYETLKTNKNFRLIIAQIVCITKKAWAWTKNRSDLIEPTLWFKQRKIDTQNQLNTCS